MKQKSVQKWNKKAFKIIYNCFGNKAQDGIQKLNVYFEL